jgi:hypothetical protein
MSLFLRQACQTSLDGVGLSNYHIQINESSKYLEVVGECGDVLVTIAGIRLSRMAPSGKEIELAVSLFDDFLAKHTATFKEFIAAKKLVETTPLPNIKDFDLIDARTNESKNYSHILKGYVSIIQMNFTLKANKDAEVTVKSDGFVQIPMIRIENPKKATDLQIGMNPDEARAVMKWIDGCKKFNDAVNIKDEALAKLSSCEI